MAVAVFATGAAAEVDNASSIDLALPAGDLTGMLLVAVVNIAHPVQPGTMVNDGAWTSIADPAGATAFTLSAAWKRFAGDSSPITIAFDDVVDGAYGVMFAISGELASGNPIDVAGAGQRTAASATVTADTITTATDNSGVVFIAAGQRAAGATTCSGYSGANPTFTETFDGVANSAAAALRLSVAIAFGTMTPQGSVGSRTATLSLVPIENIGLMFAVKPVAVAGGAPRGFRRAVPIDPTCINGTC